MAWMIEVKALKITGWKVRHCPSGHFRFERRRHYGKGEQKGPDPPSAASNHERLTAADEDTHLPRCLWCQKSFWPDRVSRESICKQHRCKTHRRATVSLTPVESTFLGAWNLDLGVPGLHRPDQRIVGLIKTPLRSHWFHRRKCSRHCSVCSRWRYWTRNRRRLRDWPQRNDVCISLAMFSTSRKGRDDARFLHG